MSSKQWLAIAAWVFVPIAATAQQKQTQYAPTDPNAPVTTIGYESAFKSYRASSDDAETPDKVWRSANDEMGKLGGHVGQMKGSPGTPATPRASGNKAPEQGGNADHSKHH
ncbi:hypothetical protein [Noviherbaspirillum saxi]|uniref:DUF4148 domain-containing protein n=1 Tax=Noviherbaspirillum saxi TaxID=2320863 RepID=A0A3A3FSC4_9BURK|nr:hypothetical protein [Noviherbaspirillum saxi]RJF98164.1 hypothetical protein D3871_06295 [Noviherbaspirillum saxi]